MSRTHSHTTDNRDFHYLAKMVLVNPQGEHIIVYTCEVVACLMEGFSFPIHNRSSRLSYKLYYPWVARINMWIDMGQSHRTYYQSLIKYADEILSNMVKELDLVKARNA